jgi:hypothetical protein
LREHEFDICDDCYGKAFKKHGKNKIVWDVG